MEIGDTVITPDGPGKITRKGPDFKEVDVAGALNLYPDADLIPHVVIKNPVKMWQP